MPDTDLSRRAVVTGLGAVTPIGNDHPTFWRNLVAGVSGGGPITHFDPTGYDVRIAAEVKDFDPTVAMDRKMARRMSRFIHLGMAAGKEAVADSGLDFATWDADQRDRVAVAVNTSGGGQEQVIDGTATLHAKGPGQVSPFAIPALSGSMAACLLSMEYGLTGPVITQVAACASSVIAFLDGLRMIQRGEVDVVLAGGSEAPLLPDRVRRPVQHGRPVQAQRRPEPRVTAVRSRPRRLPVRRRRRRGRAGERPSTRWPAAPPSTPRSSARR